MSPAHTEKLSRNSQAFKAALVSACQVVSALVLAASAAWAGDYERLASELARAARTRGVKRVAVLPFQGVGAKDGKAGRLVAERLVAPLSNEAGLEVVERTLLESVLSEQRLAGTGVTDSRALRELGRIVNADAVVAGAVASLRDDRAEVQARLIDPQTGRVLGAASARVEKDWSESILDEAGGWGPMPTFSQFDAPSVAAWDARDAVAEGGPCARARARADELETELIELKARYWAQRLRAGLSGASLKRNPGSEIANEELRRRFYDALKAETRSPSPALRSDELELLRQGLSRIASLNDQCGTEGAWN